MGSVPQPQRIPPLRPLKPERSNLAFSFKHLVTDHVKFPLEACREEFWRELAVRLREYSNGTVEDFKDMNNDVHRHTIHFPNSSEPDGFNLDPSFDLDLEQHWQFGVGAPQHGWRVHGILVRDLFYIVWVDPDHQLYPRLGRP